MKSVCFALLSLLLGGAASAALTPSCSQLATPLFGEHIEVMDAQAYAEIRNHPISTLASKLKAQGIVPSFQLDPEELYGLPRGRLGEAIQAKVLVRILNTVFPNATFNKEVPGGLQVVLGIYDSAECGDQVQGLLAQQWFSGKGHIEMPLLKTANPMKSMIGRSWARGKMGIPKSKRVLSIYTDFDNAWGGNLSRLIQSIPPETRPDVLILSQSSTDAMGDEEFFRRRLQVFREMFPQNQMLKMTDGPLSSSVWSNLPVIIFNDTLGRMPEIYAASDTAVILAANNIFEPIRADVPTLFFTGKSVIRNYDRFEFIKMARVAEASGGAISMESIDADIASAFRKLALVDTMKIKAPAFIIPKGWKKSAFSELLDQIQSEVEKMLALRSSGISFKQGEH